MKDLVIYLDDEREEHIPVLKTFRNEGNVTPCNLTVGDDKESLLQQVPYRPVIIGSSVNPLRDLEQQAGSRAFLVSIPDASPEEEKKVRKAIRAAKRTGAILSKKNNAQRDVLRAMVWILREQGVRDILIPFDAEEPNGTDRRGTGQFMKLIKISAFVNQFQRPIMELKDGRKFVLAIYDDLVTAAKVWFDFAEGQQFKISPKAIDLLKVLPGAYPGKAAPALAKDMEKSQRTIERYLEDLYQGGLVSREQMKAPGSPWGYWCEEQMRQKVLSKISDAEDSVEDCDIIPTEILCRKYMAEKSSDSLKDSIKEFFSDNDIINKEIYKGIINEGVLQVGNPEEIYLTLFSPNSMS
jgi:predicted transcriptional regulator